MISICKWLLGFYLIFEIALLTIKLYSFDLARCIKEEFGPNKNYTAFRLDTKLRQETRTFCWTKGLFKERYYHKNANLDWAQQQIYIEDIGPDCRLSEYEESDLIRKSAILVYGLFLVQVGQFVLY